ncbi:hypothetical protein E2562_025205 [Oryza meyeriana var. granulata]|uniref:Uncharacterized protein n=1 Tax=Oryza meyeriana var. granulata TaxID=110450 RepID=A0A6G1E1Q2_9ORYZ|nr:hypothetical protein E2562_025205 [Oryza meyeriana var. granulata]
MSGSGGWLASKSTNPATTNSTGMINGSDSYEPASPSMTGACCLPSEEGHDASDLFNESESGTKDGIKYDANPSLRGMPTMGYSGRSHQSFEEVDDDDGGAGPCSSEASMAWMLLRIDCSLLGWLLFRVVFAYHQTHHAKQFSIF